jgi:hypothetical protein
LFNAPFEGQTYDNLPLSMATPSTYCDKIPAKLLSHNLGTTPSDNMCHSNLKALMLKIGKVMKSDSVLIIDSYNCLIDGSDTLTPELDLLEFFNSIQAYTHCVAVNRDLLDPLTTSFFKEVKELYSYVFDVQKNQAGYSRDVHGQLNI